MHLSLRKHAQRGSDVCHQIQWDFDLDAYWDDVLRKSQGYPECTTDKYHIDILTAHFVMNPDRFDVVVASNLFGDILSDLALRVPGRSVSLRLANINLSETSHRYLSRFMDPPQISSARTLPTRLG